MAQDLIRDLFDITYGQKEYHNKQWLEGEAGDGILISSKGADNGVYGFFNIENKFKAPFITVQGYGTIGQAFVQEKDCSVDDHLLVLHPKQEMSVYEMYQVAYQIRALKWKYKYGRGITPTRLGAEYVVISDFNRDWHNYENKFVPKVIKHKTLIENENIRWVSISKLCEVKRTYYAYINQLSLDEEKTPYITTTEKNNGTGVFCGDAPINSSNQVTIALDGKCGEAFYQIYEFISGEKTAILDSDNKYLLIYIGVIVKLLSWKFHYGRKLSMERLKQMEIPIPYKNDEVDLEYIEQIVKNSYGYESLLENFA